MDTRADKAIRKLFRRDLLGLSERLRREGVEVMAANPDAAMDSYYTTPEVRRMSKADFESGGATDIDGFEAALKELWAAERRPEYAVLATRIAKVARSIRAPEESSELSQFVYVMY